MPRALIADVLQQAHGTLLTGHGSVDKTLARIRTQYYWPYMRAVVQQTILECELCQKAIQKGHGGSKLHPLPLCTGTNQRVHCDLFGPLKTISSKAHILCITDAHTKFVELVVVPNKEAHTVGSAIFNSWICRYGIPTQILTDGGKEFCNKVFHTICEFLGVDKLKTTPAHPQCNAQAEVVNKTIKKYLAAMTENSLEWEDLIPSLAFSYNTTKHRTTGMTPAELMLGYLPRSMVVKELPTYSEDPIMDTLRIFHNARAMANKEALRQTKVYRQDHDKRIKKEEQFVVGQFVLLDRRLFLNENEKLADKWEGPYVVQKLLPNGVADILRKGRTFRVNTHRLKNYQALSKILPNFTPPESTNGYLDDLSGDHDKVTTCGEQLGKGKHGREDKTCPDAEIIVKTSGVLDFPTSFQSTAFGRHPMVLRKRQSLNSIRSLAKKPKTVSAINHQLIAAQVHHINLISDYILLDEYGLPLQVKDEPQAKWIKRRRKYLKSLSPANRNALLTGDPAFAFDPLVYEYVWSRSRPPLHPKILPYFQHLPGLKEFKVPLPVVKKEPDIEMKESDNPYFSLFDEPTPSKFQPKPDPMVEDGTFYDARSSVSSPPKEDPAAPRRGEYDNPWKYPWNNRPESRKELNLNGSLTDDFLAQADCFQISEHRLSPSVRRRLDFGQGITPPSTPAASTRALTFQDRSPRSPTVATRRMEPSASHASPGGQLFTLREPLIRPSSITPQKDGTTNSGPFLTPGASYRPTVTFGRPEGSTASFSPGVSAHSAPPVTWYPPTIETPQSNLPSISYQGASALHPRTASPGSTPTQNWSSPYVPQDMQPQSEHSPSTAMDQTIGINSVEVSPPLGWASASATSSWPSSTVLKVTDCQPTTGSVGSSVNCSIQSTIRNLTSDSSATESTTQNGFNSSWTPTTPNIWMNNEYSPPLEEVFGSQPLILPFRRHQARYGMPVKWIKTHPNSYWELQQLGEALPLERFRPPPLIPIGRLQTHCRPSLDSSTSSNSSPQPNLKSKTWHASPSDEPYNGFTPTQTSSMMDYLNCWGLRTSTTTTEYHQPSWPNSVQDMPMRWQDVWSNSLPPILEAQPTGKMNPPCPVVPAHGPGRNDKGLSSSTSQWTLNNKPDVTQLVGAQKIRQRLAKQDKQFLFRTQSVPQL